MLIHRIAVEQVFKLGVRWGEKVAQQTDIKWYTPFSVPVEIDLKTKIQILKAKLG